VTLCIYYLVMIPLDSFRCTAQHLTDRTLQGVPMSLRLEGDSDDPGTWHPVKFISAEGTREDTGKPFVRVLTVSFQDETPEVIFNDSDQVEFAIPRTPRLSPILTPSHRGWPFACLRAAQPDAGLATAGAA
jgi:hypothetical protein